VLLVTFVFACIANVFGQTPVESYIAKESPIAKSGLLANIGPDGSRSSGAKVRRLLYPPPRLTEIFTSQAGVVIASPSTVDPDYLFTWIRDASLTFKVIAEKVVSGEDTSLRGKIDQFFDSQRRIQQIPNPSGTVSTGGLAEPKFQIGETAFTGSWGTFTHYCPSNLSSPNINTGRPQRDGPALRATMFMLYANWLIANGNSTWVTQNLWPVLKLDLDYVQNNWNRSTYVPAGQFP